MADDENMCAGRPRRAMASTKSRPHYTVRVTAKKADEIESADLPAQHKASSRQLPRIHRGDLHQAAIDFEGPLSIGVVAMLRVADLASPDGITQFLGKFSLYAGASKKPSIERLRLAKAIVLILEDAILSGDDCSTWKLIARARKCLDSIENNRSVAVSIVDALLQQKAYYDGVLRREPGHVEVEGPDFESHVRTALQELLGIDKRFGNLDVEGVISILNETSLRALGATVKLSMASGAFADEKRQNESDAAAFKRVKKLYEKARSAVPTS
jgi:hypothetical protein